MRRPSEAGFQAGWGPPWLPEHTTVGSGEGKIAGARELLNLQTVSTPAHHSPPRYPYRPSTDLAGTGRRYPVPRSPAALLSCCAEGGEIRVVAMPAGDGADPLRELADLFHQSADPGAVGGDLGSRQSGERPLQFLRLLLLGAGDGAVAGRFLRRGTRPRARAGYEQQQGGQRRLHRTPPSTNASERSASAIACAASYSRAASASRPRASSARPRNARKEETKTSRASPSWRPASAEWSASTGFPRFSATSASRA